MAHTPGPWEKDTGTRYIIGRDTNGNIFAVATASVHLLAGTWQGNQDLIVAAPDLLECLEELANLVDDIVGGKYVPDTFTTQPAHTAIAKARGKGG